MTIEAPKDEMTLAISVLPQAYDRLERRASAVDQTVDDYVFDLVVRDAYAPGRLERLWQALPACCSGLGLVLLAVGYFAHADAVLRLAPMLIVLALVTAIAESERQRRHLQRTIRVETRWAGPPAPGG